MNPVSTESGEDPNIDEHVKEIGKEVTEDFGRELKKQLAAAFKGSKSIKIK